MSIVAKALTCLMMACAITAFGCAPMTKNRSQVVSVNLDQTWAKADKSNQLGVQQMQRNEIQLAEKSFRKAIRTNEGHGGAHNNLGLIHYRRRNLVRAAAEFQKAIEYMPGNPAPINALGMTLEKGGRVDEAIGLYEEAHALCPKNPLFLGNLVRAKVRTECNDEMLTHQLRNLLLIETRCDWVDWVEEQLGIHMNPLLDRGPNNLSIQKPKTDHETENSIILEPANSLLGLPPQSHPQEFYPQASPAEQPSTWEPSQTLPQPIHLGSPPTILDSDPPVVDRREMPLTGPTTEGESILNRSGIDESGLIDTNVESLRQRMMQIDR